MADRPLRLAFLRSASVDAAEAYGLGVVRFARHRKDVTLCSWTIGDEPAPPMSLSLYQPDALVTVAPYNNQLMPWVASLNAPTVNAMGPTCGIPSLAASAEDHYQAVADYAGAIGFACVLYVNPTGCADPAADAVYERRRHRAAASIQSICRIQVHTAALPMPSLSGRADWQTPATTAELIQALQDLPRPLLVATEYDETAAQVLALCHARGIGVPNPVSVLGLDDGPICQLTTPALSSVRLASRQIGLQAASAVRRALDGESLLNGAACVTVRGAEVIHRQTTLAGHDGAARIRSELAAAGPHIGAMTVEDLAARCGVNTRTLQRWCRQTSQASPADLLRRARIDYAKRVIDDTDLPVSQIALMAGFASISHFNRSFKEASGMTPGAYRLRDVEMEPG